MSQIAGPEFQPQAAHKQTMLAKIGSRLLRSYMDFRDGDDVGSFLIGDYGSGDDRGWQDQANCIGVEPNIFFPERGATTREAKEVCRGCVARTDCLEYALANGEKFGIWGGLSERERRRLKTQRALASRRSATS